VARYCIRRRIGAARIASMKPFRLNRASERNSGIAASSTTSASHGFSPMSTASMLVRVIAAWSSPSAPLTICRGRAAASCWVWRSRS